MFESETHFHKWEKVQESEPNDFQSAFPFWKLHSCESPEYLKP